MELGYKIHFSRVCQVEGIRFYRVIYDCCERGQRMTSTWQYFDWNFGEGMMITYGVTNPTDIAFFPVE